MLTVRTRWVYLYVFFGLGNEFHVETEIVSEHKSVDDILVGFVAKDALARTRHTTAFE